MIKRQAPTVPFVVFFGLLALFMSVLRFRIHKTGIGFALLVLALLLFVYAWDLTRKSRAKGI
jgi:hypothetical protein